MFSHLGVREQLLRQLRLLEAIHLLVRLTRAPCKGSAIVVAESFGSGRHGNRVREHHDTVLVVRLLGGAMKLALAAAGKVLSAVSGR